jgi:hypothetical protein
MQFSKMTILPFTQMELFSHALQSKKEGELRHLPWPASTLLNTWHDSVPGRIAAVVKAKGGPTPY